jgi:geranylgeranyl diphosphate synthase type II
LQQHKWVQLQAGQDGGQWDELGSRIGEAFQVADDLRDALYSESNWASPPGKTTCMAGQTQVAEYGIEGAISHMKNILGGAISSIPCCPGEAMLAKMVNAPG